MAKHSPAPWLAKSQAYSHGQTGRKGVHWWITDSKGVPVPMDSASSPAAEFNALLFATAPDLLAELQDFHDHTIDQGWHDCDGIPGGCPVANLLRKALGEG